MTIVFLMAVQRKKKNSGCLSCLDEGALYKFSLMETPSVIKVGKYSLLTLLRLSHCCAHASSAECTSVETAMC